MDTSLTQCQSAVAETPTTKKREKNEEKHYLVHWPVLVQYIVALTLLAGGGFVLISSITTIPVTGALLKKGIIILQQARQLATPQQLRHHQE
jgi:hypothetical protein